MDPNAQKKKQLQAGGIMEGKYKIEEQKEKPSTVKEMKE